MVQKVIKIVLKSIHLLWFFYIYLKKFLHRPGAAVLHPREDQNIVSGPHNFFPVLPIPNKTEIPGKLLLVYEEMSKMSSG